VQSPIDAQPGEMCFRCAIGQNTRVPSISERNQSQPRQNQYDSAYEASTVQKRSLKAHMQYRSAEPIHVEADRANPTILHCA
jgi:hypothetical protein